MQPICVLATISFLALSAAAQTAVLANLSGVPRKQWVDVAVPATDAAPMAALCRFDPQGWIAYRGKAIGQHSVLYHVLADLQPNQRVTGHFTNVSNAASSLPPWGMSDWVADDTFAVLPVPVLRDLQGVEHRLLTPRFELVEDSSPARRVIHLAGRLGTSPMCFDAFLYVYAAQDTVEMEASFSCSDPAMGNAMSYDFAGIWLESGEYPQLDYRNRLGLPAPMLQMSLPTHPSFGRWVQFIAGARTLGRGEGLHVSGAMLCMPRAGRQPSPMSYGVSGMLMQWTMADRTRVLSARYDGPAVGLWRDWAGKWLAFGMTPEVPIPFRGDGGATDAAASWAVFQGMLQQPADMFTQRPRGLFANASSTGAQEDFGASKGSYAVTVGDPTWIHDAGYSVTEAMMRAMHYREPDGSRVLYVNHPTLQYFNQLPNCRTTGDPLGYPCPLPYVWPNTGWTTWDDQHRSQNNLNALYALTGRHALLAQLRDLAEVDKAMVPNWLDSPRAEGRLQMAWSNMLLLLDTPQERLALRQAMLDRVQTLLNNWPGAPFYGDPAHPIHAIEVGSDPTFLEPGTQTRVPALVVWEHSIATMGFYAAWLQTGDARFHGLAEDLSRMIVQRCVFLENGHWVAATAIRYLQGALEGTALPASSYYSGSPDVHVGINFWPWILPAVLICRALHPTDAALVARCNAILQDVAPNGPADWATAEWWAVLPR